ncbi:type IV pilus secretin PilQ [Immundisolibacter sp.]|uniref:type IV pilus secretin PilQ n=1 Tax=Immundisolibacter sp. TaxID=1934948 RepID=UPI00262BD95D|nr:type IV pilus secretin PilQ [Immundisolibacter sp.]MDD3650433.1 type IV pilus secretin PilQ [Immundisolibacter sp.]
MTRRRATFARVLLALTSALPALLGSAAALAVSLTGIEHAPTPSGGVQLQIVADGALPPGKSFMINDPPRLVIDLPAVGSKLAARSQAIDAGAVRSVAVVPAEGRTRLVVNLTQAVRWSARPSGNKLLVMLEPPVVAGGSGAQTPMPAARSASAGPQIKAVDFRRGERGEGRVVVNLSSPQVQVDTRPQGGRLVVDFKGVGLPPELSRRLDVTDFATPVTRVETRPYAGGVRMEVATTGPFEHLAYQANGTYTLEVAPVREDPAALRNVKKAYVGEPISLNFQSIEVRAVLQLLADFTGKNLVAADTVSGNITLRLQNVPWDQALDIILTTKGLGKREDGNVMWVAPAEEIAAREQADFEARQKLEELAPLYTEYMPVNFAKASDVAALLKSEEHKVLTERGNVTVDERTNTLIVNDTEQKLGEIRELMKVLDVPVRQVLIESRIVNASTNFSKNLGVRFGASDTRNIAGGTTAVSGNLNGTTQLINGETLEMNDRLNVNMPAQKIQGVPFNPTSIGLAIAKLPFGRLLELELSALQAEGEGEIISNPRVLTSNQKEAVISQGTEFPYQEASASGATNTEFKEAVLQLKVTPQITPDDHIIMDIAVNKDALNTTATNNNGEPAIDTQKVESQVLVNDGETIVIGGIYEQTKTNSVVRTPFFGDLPYVGMLFRNKSGTNEKKELLIFVTPKIVREEVAAAVR